MKHIQGVPKRQTILFPRAIDDYIPARRQAGLPANRVCRQAGMKSVGILLAKWTKNTYRTA